MFQILKFGQIIIGHRKVLKHGKLRNSFNFKNVIVTQVKDSEIFEFFKILHFLDHVILQKQVLQVKEAVQILYFRNDIVLKVNCFEIEVLVKILNLFDDFKVQINFRVHFRVLIKPFVFTYDSQVTLIHYHTAIFTSLQVFVFMRQF
jgi:hypothetical protein